MHGNLFRLTLTREMEDTVTVRLVLDLRGLRGDDLLRHVLKQYRILQVFGIRN